MSDEPYDQAVFIRVTASEKARLDALCALMPALRKSDVMRAALRAGMEALRENPALALGMPQAKPGPKRRRAGGQN